MMHTCYNCNRPTGADYRIVGFDIGPDGIPVNLAFCADCRARGAVLATTETGANLGELPPAPTAQLGMWGAMSTSTAGRDAAGHRRGGGL